MLPLPHHYDVTVTAIENGPAEITAQGLKALNSAPPREFDGPGDLWSPETLLMGAVADCLVLTFRAIANVSKVKWSTVVCTARGTVDRADGVTRFTAIRLRVHLTVPNDVDAEKARKALEKAEKACLVGNSLKCVPTLETEVTIEEPALAPSA
jgi:peroxiredoxin-like protein